MGWLTACQLCFMSVNKICTRILTVSAATWRALASCAWSLARLSSSIEFRVEMRLSCSDDQCLPSTNRSAFFSVSTSACCFLSCTTVCVCLVDEGEMGAGSELELCSQERSKLLRPSTYEDTHGLRQIFSRAML